MSLVGTLAKIAIGVAIVKGVGGMMQRGQTGGPTGGGLPGGGRESIPGSGSVFGGPHSPQRRETGLEDMMGDILGGKRGSAPGRTPDSMAQPDSVTLPEPSGGGGFGQGGGLGDLLESLGGGQAGGAAPGGSLGDVIGRLGQGGSGGGGLGDLLGGILGGALGGAAAGGGARPQADRGFGDLLNDSLRNRGEPQARPTPEQDAAAGLMLRAMIMAAKSDGRIDAAEKQKLLGNLGEVSPEEKRFVEAELAAPVDVAGLVRQVPRGLEQQVYAMSVMAIDLDHRNEAQYLHQLAQGLGLGQQQVNAIHQKLGATPLYS